MFSLLWRLPPRALGVGPKGLVVCSSVPGTAGSEAFGFEGSSGGPVISDPPQSEKQLQAPVVESKSHLVSIDEQHVATPLSQTQFLGVGS
jgi:hypothetical protein